jgi:hypothetical protein
MPRKVPLWKTPLPWICLVIGLQVVLVLGFVLGGTVGVVTFLYLVAIGPLAHVLVTGS